MTVYYPIIKEKQYKGYVALASPISRIQTEVRELRNSMFIAFGAAGIIGMLMSFIFANYQNRRINKLRQATHKIAEGDFDVQLKVDSQDEFDELMLDFNSMARSLREMEKEVERQENVRRQFMMDVAHEMRTPLTTMNGLLDGLKYNMVPESRRGRSLELISSETQRLIRLVNENLDYEKIRSNQIVLVQHRFAGLGAIRAVVEQMQALTKVKNNEISYDNNNFKYTYMSGLEIVTEYIKIKKVGTINKQTHYFLNRLNLVHLKINSIGNNSDINLRYYDKQYHLKLEKDFLEKETVYANNL